MNIIFYETKRLVVTFECTSDKINCTIYRKGVPRSDMFKVLQSYNVKRPGFNRLDKKTQLAALRQVLKAIRNRITQALKLELEKKS